MGKQQFWDCPACEEQNPHGGFLDVEYRGKIQKADICHYCGNLIPASAIAVYWDDDGIDDGEGGEYEPDELAFCNPDTPKIEG